MADGATILCSIALALAMDVSISVDPTEFRLQAETTAEALVSERVMELIESSPSGVALMSYYWGERQNTILPWRILRTREDIMEAARIIRETPRPSVGLYTHIGPAIGYAIDSLQTLPCEPTKIVLDISGDGVDNHDHSVLVNQRNRATEHNIIINGLPIENDVGSTAITDYYRQHVVTGFTITAYEYSDFARAILSKLKLEIASLD